MPCIENCGRCCDPVTLPATRAALLRKNPSAKNRRWLRNLRRVGKGKDGRSFTYRCPSFDPESRRCLIYDRRPEVCADYPWYGEKPSDRRAEALFPECGYRSEVAVEMGPTR